MTLPIERFKDSYQNWRWNPFTDTDMAVNAEEDGLLIPAGAPFIVQLLEQPRYNDPSSASVRCYGVDTTVDETSALGQKVLKVAATAGFAPADKIIINRGGDREEEKIVDTVQAGISLTVTVNLEFEHTAGQADVVEKYIAFAETAGAPAQSQFRVDYPPDDGEGTGLIEFNQNDAEKEVRVSYKATGSPALAETLDTKISYPAGAPDDNQIVAFSSGVPYWLQLPHANLASVTSDQHHAQAHSLASHSSKAHSELTGVGANDHHPQTHSHAHSSITGVSANQHHPQAHTHGSHSGIGVNDHHAQIHGPATHTREGNDEISHDQLGDWAANKHVVLPGTIAAVLSNHTKAVHDSLKIEGHYLGAPTGLTISGGAITVTKNYHTVDTQGGAGQDDLDTINGGVDGMVLIIRAVNSARTVNVTEAGNIRIEGVNHMMTTREQTLTFIYDSGLGKWLETAYAQND